MFDSIDDVIEALGGTSAVARMIGRRPPLVSNWRSRGNIPAEWWSIIVDTEAARTAGVTTDVLSRLASRDPVEARP